MSRRVTTTHASRGAGRPRLILLSNRGTAAFPPEGERELDLKVDITSFGSSGDSDYVLDGLRPNHAEIRRDELDEFRIYDLSGGGTAVDGWIARGTPLHTGDRVAMGAWTLCFYREEFADHHAYRPDEAMRLAETAARVGAIAVTTAKDHVRLPVGARAMIARVDVDLVFDDERTIDAILRPAFAHATAGARSAHG